MRSAVFPAPRQVQPKRQFIVDFALCLVAGAAVVLFHLFVWGFPLLGSGLPLFTGYLVAGFFMALDMALVREQQLITDAKEEGRLEPPASLYPMTRKFSLVAVVTALLVGGVMAMVVSGNIAWLSDIHEQTQALKDVRAAVLRDILFVMGVLLLYVINCILSFSKNLKLLFQNETDVLEKVSHGDLSGFVPVATSDEFGLIAGHTNTMIEGLRHRIRLLTALRLAEGLQKALLPDRAPEYRGIDLAGSCNYSELTGGDYYDFLQLPSGRPAVVVADACDHGVGAALLMTGARAFLLSAAERVDEPARIVKEINAFVSRDSEESASFLTLFLLEIDVDERLLRWVRAGHEPALLYDPERSRFEELVGEGIAVGVIPDAEFLHQERRGWSPGTVVVVGTDGIREAFNERGEMFGPERLRRVIAEHAHESAESIRDAVISRVHAFMGESAPEDDITLVVVKLA